LGSVDPARNSYNSHPSNLTKARLHRIWTHEDNEYLKVYKLPRGLFLNSFFSRLCTHLRSIYYSSAVIL
jgi:hypothetical protein